MALFGKRPSPYYGLTAQLIKEKRQSIPLRHEGQSMRKISRTLKKLSSAVAKASSTVMKLALMRTATGRPRVTTFHLSCCRGYVH
jgi:hypothetical protein